LWRLVRLLTTEVAEFSHLRHRTCWAKRPTAILPRPRPRDDRIAQLYALVAQLGKAKTLRRGGELTAGDR
jgi:hypothetical protein